MLHVLLASTLLLKVPGAFSSTTDVLLAKPSSLFRPAFHEPIECTGPVCTLVHDAVAPTSSTPEVPGSFVRGFNGSSVGPTIRVNIGERMVVSMLSAGDQHSTSTSIASTDSLAITGSRAALEKSGADQYILAGARGGGTYLYQATESQQRDSSAPVSGGALIFEDPQGSVSPFVARLEERVIVLQHFKRSRSEEDYYTLTEETEFVQPTLSPTLSPPTFMDQQHADNGRMVILRTFCPFDIDELADGFDAWGEMFPCAADDVDNGLMKVDILLYFSAAWELWPKAKETVDEVITKFETGHYPWARCFGHMYADSAMMPPEQDLYAPPMQQTNRLWVNGPNRQFEKGLRASQFPDFLPASIVGGYQLSYLMEPDSVPLSPMWLDNLLTEVEERRPFAVLGSKYRGDKWYDFLNQLELPLLNHINGNAIYNVSHVLMQLMVKQLESEADQMYNFIPFDLRMGQMWAEGALGVVQNMLPNGQLLNLVPNVTTPKNNTEMFKEWWDCVGFSGGPNGTDPVMQESVAIKNYAATNMLPKFLGPEIIIHGAAMFQRWEADRPMALVVSDWDEGFLDEFIASLDHDRHPFHEVVVMRPKGAGRLPYHHLATAAMRGIAIRTVERDNADYMDWCEAPVESEWFMYINTYWNVRANVDVLLTEDGKPLASYIYSDLPFCSDYEACASAVRRAQDMFDPDMDKHVQDFEMVFHSAERDAYCAAWKAQNPPAPDEPCVPQGPTATSYMAYLSAQSKAKKLYKLKDKAQFGWRSVFKHVHESKSQNKCMEAGIADANGTLLEFACRDFETKAACEAQPGCAFDTQFVTCYETAAPTESGAGAAVASIDDDGTRTAALFGASDASTGGSLVSDVVSASYYSQDTSAAAPGDISSSSSIVDEVVARQPMCRDLLAETAAVAPPPPPTPTPPPSTRKSESRRLLSADLGDRMDLNGWWGDDEVVLVNALVNPVMELSAGQWYRFRMVFSSASDAMDGVTLQVRNATACNIRVLAQDGKYLSQPQPTRVLALGEGGTLDAAVRCEEGSHGLRVVGASINGTIVGHIHPTIKRPADKHEGGSIMTLNVVAPPVAPAAKDERSRPRRSVEERLRAARPPVLAPAPSPAFMPTGRPVAVVAMSAQTSRLSQRLRRAANKLSSAAAPAAAPTLRSQNNARRS